MNVPARVTGSKVKMLRCVVIASAIWAHWSVVVRYGAGSWPEADSGLFSTEQQWSTGFWSIRISSAPADSSLQSGCDVWLSAGRACSGRGTPPDPSSESEPLPLLFQALPCILPPSKLPFLLYAPSPLPIPFSFEPLLPDIPPFPVHLLPSSCSFCETDLHHPTK